MHQLELVLEVPDGAEPPPPQSVRRATGPELTPAGREGVDPRLARIMREIDDKNLRSAFLYV